MRWKYNPSTCAWRKHVSYGHQPSRPWLRGHAWRGEQHTRSVRYVSRCDLYMWRSRTYGSILGLLRVATLQCDAVTLVLKTLGSNQTLDLGGLGVWLLALTLWLNLTANDELADLKFGRTSLAIKLSHALFHPHDADTRYLR